MISKTDSTRPLVVLEGLEAGNRFYTTNSNPKEDHTKLANGKTVYKVLAFCDTSDEALAVIEGDGYDPMEAHLAQHREMYEKLGIDEDFLRRLDAPDRLARFLRMDAVTATAARNIHME